MTTDHLQLYHGAPSIEDLDDALLPAGADGQVLVTDSSLAPGFGWVNIAEGSTTFETYDQAMAAISGKVHRWKFDEASGDFADSVGSLTLVASGSITYQQAGPLGTTNVAKFASAARGAAASMGSAPTGNAARSHAILFKTDGVLTTGPKAICGWGTGSLRALWQSQLNIGNVFGTDGTVVFSDDVSATQRGYADAQWHLLIAAYDGARTTYLCQEGFVNAKRMGADLNTGTTAAPKAPFDDMAIYIDDWAIFNRALTRAEMERLWRAAQAAILGL